MAEKRSREESEPRELDEPNSHVRYTGLKKAADYSLDAILQKITPEKLQECYPTVDPKVLEHVRRQIVEIWRQKADEEFDKIYKTRKLEEKLDELDDVVERAKEREKTGQRGVPVSTLGTKDLAQSRVVVLKESALERMEQKLALVKRENEELLKELAGLQGSVEKNCSDIETILGGLEVLSKEAIGDREFDGLLERAIQ